MKGFIATWRHFLKTSPDPIAMVIRVELFTLKPSETIQICTAWSLTHNYGTAKKKRPGYLVGNLVATNWSIEKALHAIGYNQIPTK